MTIVADTCIVVTPILPTGSGVLMTDSGKFAQYTPPNTGFEVVFATSETFMFRPIGGSAAHVAEVMEAEVVRVQRDICGTAPQASAFSDDVPIEDGAVICPAFERGITPLALMKSATQVA